MMRDHTTTTSVDPEYIEWLKKKEDEESNKKDDFQIEEEN